MPIRKTILIAATVYALLLAAWVGWSTPLWSLQLVKLSQYSALSSLGFLYISLCISPFLLLWPNFPLRTPLTKSRRAVGVAGWGFALLHGVIGFFGQLGGFVGLSFLTNSYLLATALGLASLFILTLLAVTSTRFAMQTLQFWRWKLLHRFVYLSTLLTVLHSLMLGTHFRSFSAWIPQIFFFLLFMLLILELVRFILFLLRQNQLPSVGRKVVTVLTPCLAFVLLLLIQTQSNIFSVHPSHDVQDQSHASEHVSDIDYKLIIQTPVLIQAGEPIPITLQVYDWQTRTPLTAFALNHEKLMHLVTVSDTLDWFQHTHPEHQNDSFTDSITFPKAGTYYLYATVQPVGKPELTVSTPVIVTGKKIVTAKKAPEKYAIEMITTQNIQASLLLSGKNPIIFQVIDTKTKQPVGTLQNYLGALGHLVMIHKQSLSYIHIHPTIAENVYALEDPSYKPIPFAPLAGHSALQAGAYKLFVEFMVNGEVISKLFDIELQ